LRKGTGTSIVGSNLADINKQIEEIKAMSRLTEAKKKSTTSSRRPAKSGRMISKLDREVKEITDISSLA
jgi:hypothetical protein